MNSYSHTQRGIISPILLITAAIFAVAALWGLPDQEAAWIFWIAAAVSAALTLLFGCLTVSDGGDSLVVSFGPIPLLRKRIPYTEMTHVEKDRSTILAGWGIHWTRKGWLWNIGGFDCVRITLRHGSTLVGTDDRDGLVLFLRSRIGSQ